MAEIEFRDTPYLMKSVKPAPNNTAVFQLALTAHQQGCLDDAEAGYLQVLLDNDRHVDAWHLLGLVHFKKGNLAEAAKLIRKALSLNERPIFLGNLADVLMGSQRLAEAEAAYRRALKLKPDFAEALNKLSLLLHDCKRLAEAEVVYRRLLKLKPNFAAGHNNLGLCLQDCKRPAEAEVAYRRALQLKPDFAEAHYNLGNLLQGSKRLAEAEAAYMRALEFNPNYAKAQLSLGVLLKDSKRLAEAEVAYQRALEVKPDFADAHNNLGILRQGSKRFAEAEAAYRRALEIKPDYAEAHNNLGLLLMDSNRLAEAGVAYQRALEVKPDFADAHNNLGILRQGSKRFAEAEAAYRRALEIKPDYAEAWLNLSFFLLTLQRYPEAWQLFESRYAPERKEVAVKVPNLSYPQWQGESLAGKSLVIWPEQGFGDYIQFVRYVPLLKARGVSRLTLVCSPPLSVLLATVEGVDAVVTDLTQLPGHDYWSFVMSLPLHCATTADTIPVEPMPYVQALPSRVAQWCERLPATGLKVGLVWKGSSGHKNDSNRSLPGLASLLPLWSVPGVTFISLQKGQCEEEALHPPAGQAIVALGAQMEDFADTAAIVSQLDLVICVDTAIAHVAGALGKPCWVLLPAMGTDWRWLLDRTDSPWYPSVRLFRQTNLEDWSETVDEVASALKTWAIVQS
jgi:tetratricopeptide (TPR) repeat protein